MGMDFEMEAARMAWRSIRGRKLRSGLTAMGIVIGIAAVIGLMSIGTGTQQYIDEQFAAFGSNRIIITPRMVSTTGPPTGSSISLTQKDVDTVLRIRGVDVAIPIYLKSLSVTFKSESKPISIYGVNGQEAQTFFSSISAFEIDSGRFLRPGDKYSLVLGSMAAKQSFATEIHVRDKVVILNKSFEVIGILKETGSTQDDMMFIMPLGTLRDITGVRDTVSIIFAQASDGFDVNDVAASLQDRFDQLYGKKTFSVYSTTQLAEQISTITGTLTMVLSGIAGIALIVAGIGIANTMYMSTLERTREIGIMKAIGATNRNILEIFLIEAAMIGLIGGVFGLMLGLLISYGMGALLASFGASSFKTLVTPELALLGVGFAIAVGMVSGFLPSRAAARKNPIEALRYE
jgi:putative ABC transport system permease protein